MDKRSKCKTRNYKTPRGEHRKTLSDINHSSILYDPHPRILETKAKINKWDLMKLKSFCTAKETRTNIFIYLYGYFPSFKGVEYKKGSNLVLDTI